MDYDKIFITIAVVLVGVLAFFGTNGIATMFNQEYGTAVGNESDFARGVSNIVQNRTTSFSAIGRDVGANVNGTEGSGPVDALTKLAQQSLGVFGAIKAMVGLAPDLLRDAAIATGFGGDEYVGIAITLFIVLFGLTIAYLFLARVVP